MSETERKQRTISSTPRLTPEEVAARTFATSFRGVSETDVRAFLKRVAEELGTARAREQELMGTIDELEARLRTPRPLDEQELLDALGEETARLLRAAREAGIDIRTKAEERASRLVHDAHEEAERVRREADEILGVRTQEAETVVRGLLEEAEQRASDLMRVADERATELRTEADRYAEDLRARADREAAAEVDGARERGIALLEDATSLRQRIIEDLGRRRELLAGQLEELRTGRDRLLDSYRVVKRTFLDATEALAQVEARATAGRPAPTSDPADLEAAVAAEDETARAAGLVAAAGPGGEAATGAVAEPPAEAGAEPGTETETPAEPEPEPESEAEPSEPLVGAEAVGLEPPAPDTVVVSSEPEATTAAVESTTEGSEPSEPSENPEPADDGANGPNLADVDDLFARLRAGAREEAAADAAAVSTSDEPGSEPSAEPGAAAAAAVADAAGSADADEDANPAWLMRRDEALGPVRVALLRQVKLAIGNEQNEVLDRVRRHKGRPVATSVLPELDTQTESWAAVVVAATSEAYRLARGEGSVGGGDAVVVPDDLAPSLARAMVEPLRERLIATIDGAHEPGETTNQVVERIGARYREWRNRSSESSIEDMLVAAYSRGHYDAAADDAVLTWCTPPGGCCPDCTDNALEPTRKGESFPTGQPFPPAHPGCRCAVAVEVEAPTA